MPNEDGTIIDPQLNEDKPAAETPIEGEPKAEEATEEKPKRSPQEELDYLEGRAKRLRKDLGIKEPEVKLEKKPAKSSEVDYGFKAYLNSEGVAKDDHEFVMETMKDTNKTAEELLGKSWFQAELKERKDARVSAEAIPKGGRRSIQSARDTVEYWGAKYESGLPLNEVPQEFRATVLNNRTAREKSSASNFSSNPIIGG